MISTLAPTPTLKSTVTPTQVPSDFPTLTPSDFPSHQPSDSPTIFPSNIPSMFPTDEPTLIPSDFPSTSPSDLPSTLPSSSPSVTCVDDKKFKFKNKTCQQIDESTKREKFCQKNKVYNACPYTCGICCQNDPDVRFKADGGRRNCDWLAEKNSRIKENCDKDKVKRGCPKTCNNCKTPDETETPSETPSIDITLSPSTTRTSSIKHCFDDENFFFNGNEERTCQFIDKKQSRRQSPCKFEIVQENCPRTCSICCADDETFTFQNEDNKDKDCAWVAKKNRTETYCTKDGYYSVMNHCSSTCSYCRSP